MKSLLLFCCLWVSTCLWDSGYAQIPNSGLSARYFSLGQGMPAQSLYGCVQDKRGFLWIATENGIARFDGFQFHRYGIQEGLPDLDVLNVFIDSTGTLWALPFQKPPVYYDPHTDHFQSLSSLAARDFRSYKGFVLSQAEIALSDIHGQIYVVNVNNRQIKDSFNFHTLVNDVVKLGHNRYGILLSRAYLIVEHHQQPVTATNPVTCPLPIPIRYALHEGDVLYCGADSTVLKINMHTGKILSQKILPFSVRQMDRALHGIYVTTLQGEIYQIHPLTYQVLLKVWQNASANEIYDSGDGIIWICTKEEGLIQLRKQHIQSISQKSIYTSSNLNCILPIRKGIVAGNNRGECIIWLQESKGQFAPGIKQALAYRPNLDAWIRKIFYNKPYFLIVSQMGLYQLQIGKKPVQIFPQYYGFKVAAPIDDSTYWLGTHGHLFICRFRQQRYAVGIVYAGKRITAIAPVSDHECYVGSNDGLYHWLNGKMHKVHLSGYVGSQKVHALARDARGWVWVAYGGDSLLAFQHDAIKLLMKTGEHFPGDIIKCLLADGEMLWVGTNNCLGKIQLDVSSPPKVRTTFFSVLDGLAGEQVNDIQRYGQYLYVATSDGVSYFPKSFTIAARDIPVYIMNMYTSRHQLADLEKPITLSYRENYIRFDLSAVDYSGLPEIWFRYRLNNHHWVFSRNPVINLYELPPGRYTLSVQAIRRDGMPSAKIATVSFEIRAPFFVKPLFWFVMVLAVLGVSAYMVWRIYRRKHRQRLMQLEQQKKITELEMQMLRAQINPHFIFNTLNAIKQMMYEHEVDQANHYLDQFSSLLRANLYTHQDDIISLEQELSYVEQYLTLEKLRFGDQFDYEIHTDKSINMSSVQVPAMMLQPVVENAVKHGIRKQKHVRGKIYILVQMQGSCCQIHILDNGPGFKPLTATAGGKGLEITRKRAEWHGLQFSLSRIVWQDQLFTAAIFQIPLSHTQIVCQPSSVVTS